MQKRFFSIKNHDNLKIITICGIKIKIKRNAAFRNVKNIIKSKNRAINIDKLNVKFIDSKNENVRLNFVTDTINTSSLLGGVGTALIIASQFCCRNNYELRIITRSTDVNLDAYYNYMNMCQEKIPQKVTGYTDYLRDEFGKTDNFLEINGNDLFFATSWWSANAIKSSGINKFFYIIQEIESFFYNYSDTHLMCSQILNDKNISFIVNHKLLWDYFDEHYPAITASGIYFNPCFPKVLYSNTAENIQKVKDKRKLFFYAREANSRNLYYTGIKILDKAIQNNIIDTKKWDIYFAGANLRKFAFSNNYSPIFSGQMSWSDYAEFLKNIDVCFSLMYTPHPSYPPLDTAQSGGVTVTNKFLNKQSLDCSKNIILAELNEKEMLKALNEGINLACNISQRIFNYEHSLIPDNWEKELYQTMLFMDNNADKMLNKSKSGELSYANF